MEDREGVKEEVIPSKIPICHHNCWLSLNIQPCSYCMYTTDAHIIQCFTLSKPKHKQSHIDSLFLMSKVKNYVHVFLKPHCFLSQRRRGYLSFLPLPPYAFVFSFALLKRINILEGIFPSAFLSFHHLPL